jgi:predicted permease
VKTPRTIWSKLRSLWQRREVKREIDEELRFHIEQRTAENLAAGLTPEEAARAARKRFGNVQRVREECRDVRGASFGEAMGRDLRFGLRVLRKNPGFTAVAVLTLALCLGANLTIFAVVDVMLLRPLPFPQPERLVTMFNTYPKTDLGRAGSSFPNLYNRRGRLEAFSSVAAYKPDAVTVGEAGGARRVEVLRVSPEFFETLGVGPVLGRSFTEEEMTFQTHHVVLLSQACWRQHFEADPHVLGREVRVNGFAKMIVGVLPPGFHFLSSKAQIFLPLSSSPDQRGINNLHNSADCEMIARLRPGATLAEAQSQIDAQNAVVEPDFPYAKQVVASGFRTILAPLHADHVEGIRPTLLLLQAGGLFLLLIGAVNLVNLLLVRASARTKELAIRRSLGASRLHVVRQVMTESVLLTLIGGLAGLGVGAAGIRLLAVFGVDQLPLGLPVAFDGRIALTALLGAVAVGLVVGVPVAGFNLQGQLANALQSETRGGTTSRAVQRLRHSFVVAQIALAFVLLTGTGLLGVSLERTMEISPGFRPDHVLAGHISMLHKNYLDRPARLQFAERLFEEIRRQPGVQAVGIVSSLPVAGKAGGNDRRVMTVPNRPAALGELPLASFIYGVAGDYFRALGIPLRAGQLFDGAESRRNERVCIVDETFARRNSGLNAVGQLVYDGPEVKMGELPFTVIGVVGAVKQKELTEQQVDGAIYFPLRDHPLVADHLYVAIRTRQRPEAIGLAVQKVVRGIEPELPVNDLRTMETRIADTLIMRRSPMLLAGVFAGVALLLAAIGTYGVLSFAVAQRRREIGVRLALGALPGQIGRQFLSLGLRLLLVGTLLGVVGAWLAGRAMQSILFEVPPFPIATLAGTALIIGAVSLVACLLPARRASRVAPLEALRHE